MALSKTAKWVIIVVAAAVIIIVIAVWYFTSSSIPTPTEAVPAGSPTPTWIPEAFPLNVGMYGSKIKKLQEALGVTNDGKLGSGTKGAIQTAGYAVPLSETDYNKIIASSATSAYLGKNAYSIGDGTSVYDDKFKLYKTAKKDEYIGKISGLKGNWYQVASGLRQVNKDLVYLK